MTEKYKNILIGLFLFAAIVSTIYIILFLEPSIGDGKQVLHVRFSNIASINVGTQVTLAGKPVGEVVSIKAVPDARDDITDELGRVYFYELTLRVDSSVEVYNTDEITIATTGLLGEKSIAIIPKAPLKGKKPKRITDEIIYAQSVEPLESAFHTVSELGEKLDSAITNLDKWFTENYDDLSRAVKSFADAMKEIDIAIATINQQELIESIREATDSFIANMKLVESSLQEIQDDEMLAKLNTILENMSDISEVINVDGKQILGNINIITQDISDGSGSLGKFIKSDDLYLRIIAITSKIDTLMNDINHYGLLFQYDKHWQRIRTKRANLLEALKTPRQFKNYFEAEIDDITTSLARISILLEKAKEPKEKEKIMISIPFKKDFAHLLREVEDLLDSLKNYNENLVEMTNKEDQ